MKLTKKIFFVVTVSLIFATLFVGCAKEEETPTSIKIGGVYPLSGEVALYGIEAKNGVDLAIEEINAAGGILGLPIEHIAEDDEGAPEKSVNAFTKLVSKDKVGIIIGSLTSGCTKAIAPKAQAKGVVQMAPAATADDLTSYGDYIFRVCYSDSFQGSIAGVFSAKNLGSTRAAVLYDNGNDYCVGLYNNFKKSYEENGGTIVIAESYGKDDVDFNAQLTKIKNANPDLVFLPDYYQKVALIVKQLRDAGINTPIVGADGWDGITEKAGNEVLNGYYSAHYSADSGDETVTKFVSKFTEKYGTVPTAFAALGYDSMYVIRDAIERAGTAEPEAVKEALEATDGHYVTGDITFDENHNPVKTLVMLEIVEKDGKLTTEFNTLVEP